MRSPGPKTGARRSLGPLTVIAELSFLPSRPAQEQSLEEKQLWPREDTGSCSAPAMRQGLRQRRRGKEDAGAVQGRRARSIAQAQVQAQGRSRGV